MMTPEYDSVIVLRNPFHKILSIYGENDSDCLRNTVIEIIKNQ